MFWGDKLSSYKIQKMVRHRNFDFAFTIFFGRFHNGGSRKRLYSKYNRLFASAFFNDLSDY